MKTRPLTKEEINTTKKNIKRLEDENKRLRYKIELRDMFLTRGLYIAYLEQREKTELEKRELVQELHTNNTIIEKSYKIINAGEKIK